MCKHVINKPILSMGEFEPPSALDMPVTVQDFVYTECRNVCFQGKETGAADGNLLRKRDMPGPGNSDAGKYWNEDAGGSTDYVSGVADTVEPEPEMEKRRFDSLGGGEIPLKRRHYNAYGDWSFDSLGGGVIPPRRRRPMTAEWYQTVPLKDLEKRPGGVRVPRRFDSLGGGILPPARKARVLARRKRPRGAKKVPPKDRRHGDLFSRRFDSLGGGYVPFKREPFDSLGGGQIPPKKH